MDGGNWRGEGWPGPEARARQRLPRVEDLPPAEHGYDRERVHEAFDSFYRHIAQLDSTLRALEAVEVFRDQAGELRRELRALKAAGWTQQPWPAYAPARVSPGLPESLPRFAIEAAFLIIVAVVVAVAQFDRLSIVLVMALAWAIVGVVEWAASRERLARARGAPPMRGRVEEAAAPAPLRIVPAPAAPAESWDAPAAPAEPDEDERTIVRPAAEALPAASEEVAADAGADAVAPEPVAEAVEPVAEAAEPVAEAAEPEPPVGAYAEPLSAEPATPEPVEAEPAAQADEPPVDEPVAEPEPLEAASEPEADAAPEPAAAPSRWSWAADAAVERARERELEKHPPEPRRRFWQRRKRDSDGYRFESAQPKHVRVLPPEPPFDEQFPVDSAQHADPWEQDLDLSIEEPEGPVNGAAEPEREAALDRERG